MMRPSDSSFHSADSSRAFSHARGRFARPGFIFALALVLAAMPLPFAPVMVPGHAWAQSDTAAQAGVRIGTVDMTSVLQNSDAILTVRNIITESNESFQQEIAAEEEALRTIERELLATKDNLPEAEFRERLESFKTRKNALQQKIQSRRRSFDQGYSAAHNRVAQELVEIVKTIAQERGFSVVIERKSAVIFSTDFDITDEALRRLNERTKNLRFSVERGEAQPAGDNTAGKANTGGKSDAR